VVPRSGWKNSIKTLNEHRHIPAALGFWAIVAEFFGGAGLIVGLLSRIAATSVVVIMAVAIALVHAATACFSTGLAITKTTDMNITSWPLHSRSWSS
jgi:uncharacterized membrane protein YphA (DoxX/SURF4 family)